MLLSRESSPQCRLLLLAKILDLLERDYREAYPDEAPVIDGGYEQFVRKMIFGEL